VGITTLSSREFNQDRSRAKKAAKKGPVFITDRGQPSLVILSFDEYQRIAGSSKSIGDLLSDSAAARIEFDPPRMGDIVREVDLS
jgi:hypothetical protein